MTLTYLSVLSESGFIDKALKIYVLLNIMEYVLFIAEPAKLK